MPPHCDTRDGSVVKAAIKALEAGNLNYVLIWIPQESEKELKGIFEKPFVREKPVRTQRRLLTTGSLKIPSASTAPAREQRIPA